MIFVTVGMQLGFDRLIKAMDILAPRLSMPVIAQIGQGRFQPQNIEAHVKFEPREFDQIVRECQLIVSHAGVGTILTAQRLARPLVLFPRRAELGEHRNDHQLATAYSLAERPGIAIAMDEKQLPDKIEQGLALAEWTAQASPSAERLNDALIEFIETGQLQTSPKRTRGQLQK